MAAKELRLSQTRDQFFGLSSIYQVTMCPELLHKERNNVLSLWNNVNEQWHLTWYIEHHPVFPYKSYTQNTKGQLS